MFSHFRLLPFPLGHGAVGKSARVGPFLISNPVVIILQTKKRSASFSSTAAAAEADEEEIRPKKSSLGRQELVELLQSATTSSLQHQTERDIDRLRTSISMLQSQLQSYQLQGNAVMLLLQKNSESQK